MEPYLAVTQNIKVAVVSEYLADQSNPAAHQYFWSYTIEISNLGSETVTLLSRHWKITDARGSLHEVKGPGVVGQQPDAGPWRKLPLHERLPA